MAFYFVANYHQHHLQPEVQQPIFDHFQHLDISEQNSDIARIIKVPMKW
jgi:hypothetical protein